MYLHPLLQQMKSSMTFSGDLEEDVSSFLRLHNHPHTAEHCLKVGYEAGRLAARFGCDADQARAAGFLHDISAIIPNNQRIDAAREWNLDILPEEERFPMIIHQKLSRVIAEQVFGIELTPVLEAIECHTTLKAPSTLLDKIVFIADKIEWDQSGQPPYLAELLSQLDISLEHGVYVYIEYLWSRREHLKVVHPWLIDAHTDLVTSLRLGRD
ncbi:MULTISPECIES: bis(5'-nucleosyl)-tetraphosphatase (symmetrical) YqeK [unclassified Paenibacillus]|uniref:bis(5'-nucleosyl)-tetraphosphatase (symmetrical) YqeK n=1 Tax=unclassified Paenibacillus TaxID=185978 RepID=UPI0036435D47